MIVRDHVLEIYASDDAPVRIAFGTGSTLYYKADPSVSSLSYDGSLAAGGASVIISEPTWMVSAGRTTVSVTDIFGFLTSTTESSISVSMTTGGSPRYQMPGGSPILTVNQYGDVFMGENLLVTRDSHNWSFSDQLIDFAYIASSKRLATRNLFMSEIANPSNIRLARWGPTHNLNTDYPTPLWGSDNTALTGIQADQTIGKIDFAPSITVYGGTPNVTGGGYLSPNSAEIAALCDEDPIETDALGTRTAAGRLEFLTTPTGTETPVDRLMITSYGAVGVLSSTFTEAHIKGTSSPNGGWIARGDFVAGGKVFAVGNVIANQSITNSNGASYAKLGAAGPGSEAGVVFGSAGDTNLYRSAADTLKTDDKLLTAVGLGVGNSAAGSTLGTVTKKMQVFDASGSSLGYVPIYDAIT